MSDFNARGDVYRSETRTAGGHRPLSPSQPVYSGTVADCVKWVMAKKHDYPETYFMTVPLEAGFIKSELCYQNIEAISQRADFTK
jgi:hypothetical protein